MIKVIVLENFSLAKFNELKNIERASGKNQEGYLFKNDKFDCEKEMADYLLSNNKLGKAFVKVIEIIPEESKVVKENKTKKVTTTKKETKSKKSIAKK